MPLKRALVECAVLALQDSCVFYPCCKGCFSKMDTESDDYRLTCSKCGYSCAMSLLDYRYRLSLRVARGTTVFGVTVFGNCLTQFFGIDASGLQRLMVDRSGPESSQSTLLKKAVEESFVGKHFIFGIKVNENDIEPQPWMENTKGHHMAQLIATQMLLPNAVGLRGRTVLHYYDAVWRAAQTVDPDDPAEVKQGLLWPVSHNSSTPGFTNDTLNSSDFLPLSLSSSLSLTPPWQQTLGLITSSAEQEESYKEGSNHQSFGEPCRRSVAPTEAWLGLTPPFKRTAELQNPQVNNLSTSFLATHPAQDQSPLSESLTEFLKDTNIPDHSHRKNMVLNEDCDGMDFMERNQVCNDLAGTESGECSKLNEASVEEQSESSVYNCSADLFSCSPRRNFDVPAFVPLLTNTGHAGEELHHAQSSVVSFSRTPEEQLTEMENDQKPTKCNLRESFRLSANFDFIPPSQSTPAERRSVQKGMSLLSDLKISPKGDSAKENINQTSIPSRMTPKSRYLKVEKHCGHVTKKRLSSCRGVLNSAVCKRRLSGFGHKDNSLIIPPTPAHLSRTLPSQHSKEQTFNDCKPSRHGPVENESGIEECDWSRDLFSDSE